MAKREAAGRLGGRVVALAVRRPWLSVAAIVLLTVLAGLYVARNLRIDTDLSKMIDASLPWRQAEDAFARTFPQTRDLLLVVVEGETADLAEDAAERLAAALLQQSNHFHSVRRPGGDAFFRRNGLLFLPLERLQPLLERAIAAQPLLGMLAADPHLTGLALALERAVASAGAPLLSDAMVRIAESVEAALRGERRALSWTSLLSGQEPRFGERLRLLLVKPKLDYSNLAAGAAASKAVRWTAAGLGLTPERGVRLRLTGSVALADDELASIANDAGIAFLLSVAAVLGLLFWALGSPLAVLASMLTLAAGLVWTLAFATLAVGVLNPISVAFVVMFVGIAIDFSIQFCARWRHRGGADRDQAAALIATGEGLGGALTLAAAATAAGFAAFIPTAYRGVGDLGQIAVAGMFVALALNLTLLPALLAILRPRPAPLKPAASRGGFVHRQRSALLGVCVALGCGALAALPALRFDFNPLNLKDPTTESIETLRVLARERLAQPFTLSAIAASAATAEEVTAQLGGLPQVGRVLSINSFVPAGQPDKLALIEDARLLLAATLQPGATASPPSPDALRRSLADAAKQLAGSSVLGESGMRLSNALSAAARLDDEGILDLQDQLLGGLPGRLEALAAALWAEPVSLAGLPATLREEWLTPDGRARIEVEPAGNANDSQFLRRFVAAVRTVLPEVTDSAITIQLSAEAVVRAFLIASGLALLAIALLLYAVLRRLNDVALVLGPLCYAALLTVALAAVLGLGINFANIIGLPLLLGIGVAYNIYFVVNWRADGGREQAASTARAVIFSALTTLAAFASLALSRHVGTADMGRLLSLAIACTLFSTFVLLPALLGPRRRRERTDPAPR
ncbi:MAG: hopanoid biosynthesis-associated RND transporter HpnN [Alphaproteobacteria bacterium]|nr:hopanoid biosynthesis-associated RND transporter HpnN [Alphaproteobacteria bacterium]